MRKPSVGFSTIFYSPPGTRDKHSVYDFLKFYLRGCTKCQDWGNGKLILTSATYTRIRPRSILLAHEYVPSNWFIRQDYITLLRKILKFFKIIVFTTIYSTVFFCAYTLFSVCPSWFDLLLQDNHYSTHLDNHQLF